MKQNLKNNGNIREKNPGQLRKTGTFPGKNEQMASLAKGAELIKMIKNDQN
jgi:hypothetical protein